MALTITSPLTTYHSCDTSTAGFGVDGVDTDLKLEGSGCWASDVDVETHLMTGGVSMTAVNMSTTKYGIYAWVLCFTAAYLDTKANGGIAIILEDSSGNQNYYNCGGSDTYPGGWEVMVANSGATPDGNNGTACDLTDVVTIGVKWKGVSKSKLADNCFVDYIRYGSGAALKITGTNTTTDDGWSEVLSGDDTLIAGIIKTMPGGYILKGPVQIGDDTGTLSTNFSDSSNIIIFDDMPVGAAHHAILLAGNSTGTTQATLKNQVLKAATSSVRFTLDATDTNLTSLTLTGTTLANGGVIDFKSGQTVTGNVFQDCLEITPSTSTFENNTISGYTGTAGALDWPGGTTVKSCAFNNNSRAIEITQTANQTFDALLFSSNTYDVHLNNGGNSIDVSKNNGSDPTTYVATGGGVVTFVGASVTVTVTVQKADGTKIENARVFLAANETVSGGLPYQDTVTIVNSGTTATVTHTSHGLATGDRVVIEGASHTENNGVHTVTVTNTNTYTYTMTSAPGSSPTGTILSTFVFVYGLSSVLGVVSTSRVLPATQGASGWARKSSASPYFKTGPLSGDISSSADSPLTAILAPDE